MSNLEINHFGIKHLTPQLKAKLYKDIKLFRNTFNLPVETGVMPEHSDVLHTSLAVEELTEIADAVDLVEISDGIVDVAVVALGREVELGMSIPAIDYLVELMLSVARAKGIDFIRCWDEVLESNLSKTAKNEKEVNDNIEFYKGYGVVLDIEEKDGTFLLKNAKECVYKGKELKVGKVMKSIYYKEADLSFVLEK